MISKRKYLSIMAAFVVSMPGHAQQDDSFNLPQVEAQSNEELSQALSVFVNSIEVLGVTAVDQREVAALTAAYEGRNVSSSELQELRLQLSNLYLENNYVNSGVILPDQSISDGVIYFQAIEGGLSRIEIEGDPHIRNRYLEKRLARHIDYPVRIEDVQYALQHLQNDSNVLRLDASLAPGDELGESVLRVAVDEPTRFEFGMGTNNHRATSTGEFEANVYWRSRNWAGIGEVIDIFTGVSDGADNTSVSFSFPISRRNTSLQLYAGDSDSSIVEARLRDLDIESVTETRGIQLSHPFVDRLDKTLTVSLGYESRHSETTLGGILFSLSPGAIDGISETNAAVLSFDWTGRGENHVLATRVTYRHGDDYQDATVFTPPQDDRFELPFVADGYFDLVRTQLLFLRRMGRNGRSQFVFRSSGQFSRDPLMSIEKLAIGGVDTVRGYPENFWVRDNGVSATIEFRLPLTGTSDTPGPGSLSLVPFIDYGRSWDEVDTDTISTDRDTSKASSITSVGLGLVWEARRGLRAELFWGTDVNLDLGPGVDPRDTGESNLQDDGIHFSLSYAKNW